ncbi:RNA polymerase sigma-70 factor [uncultured Sunxiuqinia sp.]|uniref:RNA polymerase sigma-70 factor n=1 Tax=Sunxiuqinia rutila TaxID=1397841 RepID=UPI00261450C7|nr:RNA polymerase sigma-70 factor [uncultured Sunxiuqinia sp.]
MQIIDGVEEGVLIDKLIQGDQLAFEKLFRFYYPGLAVYARQFVTDAEKAEEIVQDFFVRFWEKHTSLQPSDSLKSYLFSSVKNSSLNVLKRLKVEERYLRNIQLLSDDHLLYDPDLYIASELQDKIQKAIDKLPDRCREVFILSRINGLKNDEIALQLNISKRTVETQISKALKILKVELKEYIGLLALWGFINL